MKRMTAKGLVSRGGGVQQLKAQSGKMSRFGFGVRGVIQLSHLWIINGDRTGSFYCYYCYSASEGEQCKQ
jgi:hypothetical protein